VPGLRSQYGCEYRVSFGILDDRSFVTSSFDGSAASILIDWPVLGNRTSCSVIGTFERLIASSFIAAVCPGVNVAVAVDASTCKLRHAAMILSKSAFFSGIQDSYLIPLMDCRSFNKSGTDAAGSADLNFEINCRISVAYS